MWAMMKYEMLESLFKLQIEIKSSQKQFWEKPLFTLLKFKLFRTMHALVYTERHGLDGYKSKANALTVKFTKRLNKMTVIESNI